jgi:hypothetical protein
VGGSLICHTACLNLGLGGRRGKDGCSHGDTDELGHEATVNRHHIRDLHATILHLMGLNH